MPIDINYLAVLVAAISSFVLGFVWYGFVFKKPWIKAMELKGGDMEMKHPRVPYLISFIAAFVMAAVLSHVLAMYDVTSSGMALTGAIWLWLGFVGTVMARNYAYGMKKNAVTLWFIDSGYILVELIVMALIVTAWV